MDPRVLPSDAAFGRHTFLLCFSPPYRRLFQALTRPADLRRYLELMTPQENGPRHGPLRTQIDLLTGTLQVDVSLLKVAWTRTFTWSVVFSPFRLPLALHLLLVWQGVYLCVLIA